MSGIYYTSAADWLRAIGLMVVECDGWKSPARSSGGFASPPLGVQWHHTASNTSPENDVNYQMTAEDAPIGNGTIMRDGSVWLIAAGAANTAGKGGPVKLSRGTVGIDKGNTQSWAWEVANAGTGQQWPSVQIDAYFAASNEMNRRFGNQPTDVFTHAIGAGDGYTDRKIDPATAAAVQGSWKPSSCSSSGTWSLADIRAECSRRAAGSSPEPEPKPPEPEPEPEPEDDDIMYLATLSDGAIVVVGSSVRPVSTEELSGPYAALERHTPPPSSYWHEWLTRAADEYSRRVGMG